LGGWSKKKELAEWKKKVPRGGETVTGTGEDSAKEKIIPGRRPGHFRREFLKNLRISPDEEKNKGGVREDAWEKTSSKNNTEKGEMLQ